MSYKSEAAFGHALDSAMSTVGYDVHNIQTPSTERGCPDRFLQKGSLSAWIELKNVHYSIRTPEVLIPYRPGQQKWLYLLWKHGGRGFTAVAGEDGILIFQSKEVLVDKLYRQGSRPQLIVSHLYKDTIDKWLQTFAYIS